MSLRINMYLMEENLKNPTNKHNDDAISENEIDDKIQKELQKLIELNDLRAGALRKMINKIGDINIDKQNQDNK
jgi:hypothetical protein